MATYNNLAIITLKVLYMEDKMDHYKWLKKLKALVYCEL